MSLEKKVLWATDGHKLLVERISQLKIGAGGKEGFYELACPRLS